MMPSRQSRESFTVETTVLLLSRAVALKYKYFRLANFRTNSRILDETHEFQAGRWTIETVSAFASVELAITGIVSDPRRY